MNAYNQLVSDNLTTYCEAHGIPAIVTRAKNDGVVDIGQLSKQEVRTLKSYVKKGVLKQLMTYRFPIPKKLYVSVDYYGII